MNAAPNFYTTRYVRKVSTNSTAAGILILLGILLFFFVNWVIGLILLVIGIGLSGANKRVSTCGECGNEVANTSRVCPHCRARFNDVRKVPMSKATFYAVAGSLITLSTIGVAMWWLINNANR